MNQERSPAMKLLLAGLVAAVLIVPLMMVYALVYDRESQSQGAQSQITQGWGGAQKITGAVLVMPYTRDVTTQESVNGQIVESTRTLRDNLFISPTRQSIATNIASDRKGYAIYESVVFESAVTGTATFDMPADLDRLGIDVDDLQPDQAELRFGVSDPRGLTDGSSVTIDGQSAQLLPGNGPAATGGSGFSANVEWSGEEALDVEWSYGVRGSRSIALVPRGGETEWQVTSPWPHPSFTGSYLPDEREITPDGFTATYAGITNLSLGERLVNTSDLGARDGSDRDTGEGAIARIGLVDPVDLYSQVDRAVKYSFLFIGFTFAAFLMFDIVGGARVASAEYLLTGAGLILFFVMLLAFAEVFGFAWAYLVAAAAVIGLLTTYSAAVLGTWKRASFIGAMLAGLYGVLYVLLNLETYNLVIGALLLFVALAGIMYTTRGVQWSTVGRSEDGEEGFATV